MKGECIFHYVLAILEGALSGAIFYRAGKTEKKKSRILLFAASAAWFVLSLTDSFQGGQALRELREQKKLEINGGDDDE